MSKNNFDEKLCETVYGIPLQDAEYIELETLGNIKKLVAEEVIGNKLGPLPTGYYPESHQELDARVELQLQLLYGKGYSS